MSRLGLTLGLGIDAATAGVGAADPLPASDPAIVISIDGLPLLEEDGATTTSGTGDIAIAIGSLSTATATGGTFDTTIADGLETSATADGGNFDTAIANGDNDFVVASAIAGPGPNATQAVTTSPRSSTSAPAPVPQTPAAPKASPGDYYIAAILFGIGPTATATGADCLSTTVP